MVCGLGSSGLSQTLLGLLPPSAVPAARHAQHAQHAQGPSPDSKVVPRPQGCCLARQIGGCDSSPGCSVPSPGCIGGRGAVCRPGRSSRGRGPALSLHSAGLALCVSAGLPVSEQPRCGFMSHAGLPASNYTQMLPVTVKTPAINLTAGRAFRSCRPLRVVLTDEPEPSQEAGFPSLCKCRREKSSALVRG